MTQSYMSHRNYDSVIKKYTHTVVAAVYIYIYMYIYVYACVCVCMCVCVFYVYIFRYEYHMSNVTHIYVFFYMNVHIIDGEMMVNTLIYICMSCIAISCEPIRRIHVCDIYTIDMNEA